MGAYKPDTKAMVFIPPVRCFDRCEADKQQALKVLEEASEVVEAVKQWMADGTYDRKDRIVEECCDVVQAVCNLLHALGEADISVDMGLCERRNRERGRIS